MEGQQFTAFQDIASRVEAFFATKNDVLPYQQQQTQLHDMRTKYHEGDVSGALSLSQQLIEFLEVQETADVQLQQTIADTSLQQSLQQELIKVTDPVSDRQDFWKIFFMSLFFLALCIYIWTWWDIMLVWLLVGGLGIGIVRYMR